MRVQERVIVKRSVILALLLSAVGLAASAQSVSSTRIVAVYGTNVKVAGDFASTTVIDVVNTTSTSIGNVTISSNIPGSWTIRIISANGGSMKGDNPDNTGRYPYLLEFGTATGINLMNEYKFVTNSSATSAIFPLAITYQKAGDMHPLPVADTYRDVITVSVGAN